MRKCAHVRNSWKRAKNILIFSEGYELTAQYSKHLLFTARTLRQWARYANEVLMGDAVVQREQQRINLCTPFTLQGYKRDEKSNERKASWVLNYAQRLFHAGKYAGATLYACLVRNRRPWALKFQLRIHNRAMKAGIDTAMYAFQLSRYLDAIAMPPSLSTGRIPSLLYWRKTVVFYHGSDVTWAPRPTWYCHAICTRTEHRSVTLRYYAC